MSTITTRAGKGSPLTNTELDANFTNLNNDKLEKAANLSDLSNVAQARINLGLSAVAASGAYADLTGQPPAVTSSEIISALGYTPYDASNPNGYTNSQGSVASTLVETIAVVASMPATPNPNTLYIVTG